MCAGTHGGQKGATCLLEQEFRQLWMQGTELWSSEGESSAFNF